MAKTYTTLPGPAMDKLEPYLKEHNIPFDQIWGPELAEHPVAVEACYFDGRYYIDRTICLITDMEPRVLAGIAERLSFGNSTHFTNKLTKEELDKYLPGFVEREQTT